ncbi:MAG TPA: gamma-glutamyl-gamma-aminobutyrate hydrolase family protein [Vicinamibacteria bacterium]|nr:gamma-glutamyl-gamma-aminobutyrate hydrolase family protein [Vicinamibacteria bacterium]
MTRPAIGITIGYDEDRPDRHLLREDYVKSVVVAGGLPYVLAPVFDRDIPALLDRLEGLVLTGGSDVDPEIYGEKAHPQLGPVFRVRDDFEVALCREALRRDLPILAICRGHQVLNVATGGTLIQDLPSQQSGGGVDHDPDTERAQRVHDVRIAEACRLRRLLGKETVGVNSFHHQAIRHLGPGLVATAWSPDGVVEAVEASAHRYVLGVQWHPESFWREDVGFRPLFRALVEEAAK